MNRATNQTISVQPMREIQVINRNDQDWTPENTATGDYMGSVQKKHTRVTSVVVALDSWSCTIKIPDVASRVIFPVKVDHIIDRFSIGTAQKPPSAYRLERVSPNKITVTVTNPQWVVDCSVAPSVEVRVATVQAIGGSRLNNTILIGNDYLYGPAGSDEANSAILVLFLHEIGHALGMVPATHPHYYDKSKGGVGSHCAMHTRELPNDEAALRGLPPDGLSGSVKVPALLLDGVGEPPCAMFHTRTPVHWKSTRFCPECIRTMRDVLDADQWKGVFVKLPD